MFFSTKTVWVIYAFFVDNCSTCKLRYELLPNECVVFDFVLFKASNIDMVYDVFYIIWAFINSRELELTEEFIYKFEFLLIIIIVAWLRAQNTGFFVDFFNWVWIVVFVNRHWIADLVVIISVVSIFINSQLCSEFVSWMLFKQIGDGFVSLQRNFKVIIIGIRPLD